MQLQKALLGRPEVIDAGVVMGTEANKQILQQSGLWLPEVQPARPEDLIIAVRAENQTAAEAALAQVDTLLARRAVVADFEYRPRSLDSAIQMLPQAQWVLVSVPGRYAAGVARDALRLNRHVFLYSDNVPLEEEISLKQTAQQKGLLVLGPDCGTAIVNGVGLGFANCVRRGRLGVVGAAGTGLQVVTARIHNLGAGISHAIGTGTRDFSEAVGAVTARQGLGLLSQDRETDVIVLISKPPSPSVAGRMLRAARAAGKPVVVDFIGCAPPSERDGNLYFARTLDQAAEKAVTLERGNAGTQGQAELSVSPRPRVSGPQFAPTQRYVRGLYSGGTLAYEAQLLLCDHLGAVYSNAPLDPAHRLASPALSQGHTILDLGADEFTFGRLHPMLDNDLRLRRLRQEADDPEVAVILLDVVLGYGAHPDPASELAPVIAQIRAQAAAAGRHIQVIVAVIGTDEDPQNLTNQVQRLSQAGAWVETSHTAALETVGALMQTRSNYPTDQPTPIESSSIAFNGFPQVGLFFQQPFAAINVGLESFYASLKQQGAPVIQVDWRPPAGGNERLMAILEKLKREA